MKQPCELIEDILPLYVEDEVSGKTREIVEEHLRECPRCQNLCEEFKNPKPVLPDLKESLPEANTLKRSFKRLKSWALAGLVLIILAGIGIGIAGYKAGSAAPKDILSVNDVTRTLKKTGLALTPDSALNPEDYKMGDQVPSIYKLNAGENLFIYCFTSIGERNTEFREWEEKNRPINGGMVQNMFTAQGKFSRQYAAKNTLIVCTLSKFPDTEAEFEQKVSPLLTTLSKAIFYNLNDGQKIVFQGESNHWKGKVTLNYYQHFWSDEQGVLRYDSWNHELPTLEFKGDDRTITGNFSCEFKSSAGSSLRTDVSGFHPDQFSNENGLNSYGGASAGSLGFGGNNGAIPQKDEVYTVTVKWNNQQETFGLKAVSQTQPGELSCLPCKIGQKSNLT